MKTNHALCGLISGLLLLAAGTSHAQTFLNENFDDYFSLNPSGSQFDTGLNVYYGGSLTDFDYTGFNAIHAVDLSGAGNYAPMFYSNNVITLALPVAANTSGASYSVSFDAGPAVYSGASQKTLADDGLVFNILRGNDSVLSSFTYQPGAWAGSETLAPVSFQYTGDGTGDIRVRVGSLIPSEGRFGGAIDNLTIGAVPEPTSAALLLGSGAMLLLRRRRLATL